MDSDLSHIGRVDTEDQLYSVIANSQSCGVDIINEMLKDCSS